MKLNLGVDDVAYTEKGQVTTTGDVAEILEDNYHVMRTFAELHDQDIADALADGMAKVLEAIGRGDPVPTDLSQALVRPMGQIETEFRDFLDRDEMGAILPASQQSQAALKGVNHRKKRPYVKANKARPSFIDTGLYQASFRAWIES